MSESSTPTGQTEPEPQPTATEDTESDTEYPITREQQMVFGDGGEIEPDGDSVETSLAAFGAEVDHSNEATQLAEPAATKFGVDDRQQATQRNKSTTSGTKTEGDQRSLFADVENNQQTLGGENAATRCLFESSESSTNGGDEEQ